MLVRTCEVIVGPDVHVGRRCGVNSNPPSSLILCLSFSYKEMVRRREKKCKKNVPFPARVLSEVGIHSHFASGTRRRVFPFPPLTPTTGVHMSDPELPGSISTSQESSRSREFSTPYEVVRPDRRLGWLLGLSHACDMISSTLIIII